MKLACCVEFFSHQVAAVKVKKKKITARGMGWLYLEINSD